MNWLMQHRTKALGFAQITVAQIMLWNFIPPHLGIALASANGLLTVWVGFLNSQKDTQ